MDRCPTVLAQHYLNFHWGEMSPAVQNETSFTFDAFSFRGADPTFEINCNIELCAGDSCPAEICPAFV